MDRLIVYPGAIPLETDILTSQKNALIGLSKLAAAMLGTSTIVNGLSCVPTGPASLQVVVNAGEIYTLANVDGTSYGSLAADTTHQIVKQGILLDAATLSCPAPGTGGFSINYLVEAQYQDLDGTPIVLPYYNSSNPAVAYSGPGNTGVAQNTVRQGKCAVQVKAGTAATTGTQTTPSADAGYTGLWVVTVANGATTITAPNITVLAGAPFLNARLPMIGGFQSQSTISATKVFNAASIGQSYLISGAQALTLPAASTVPAGAAIAIEFATAGATLTRSASDTLTFNGVVSNTFTASAGDRLKVVSDGVSVWISIIENTASWTANLFSSVLGQTLATAGYQKFPGGLIIQWGPYVGSVTPGNGVAVTYPISFASNTYSIAVGAVGSGSTTISAWVDGATTTGFNGHASAVSGNVNWIATGK